VSENKKLEELLQQMSNDLKELKQNRKEQSQSTGSNTSSEPPKPAHTHHSANVDFSCPDCQKEYDEKVSAEAVKTYKLKKLKEVKEMRSPELCEDCGEIYDEEKKKIAPAATNTSEPEPAEAEIIKPEPAEPKPETPIPLTPEQRIEMLEAKLAANEKQVENAFGKLVERLTPVIQLSDKLAQAQEQAKNSPQQPQQGAAGLGGSIGQFLPMIMQALSGGGGSALGDELTKKVMDAGLSQMFAGTELLKALQRKMLLDMGSKQIEDSLGKAAAP
jgi:uncharacterized coiled-coil protein SlyX